MSAMRTRYEGERYEGDKAWNRSKGCIFDFIARMTKTQKEEFYRSVILA